MPDATIIGAGPAGSVAAILLARHGWDITLIEQHRFPRDKVCGECLSALGIECLGRIALKERISAQRPAVLRRATLVSIDGSETTLKLPDPMWGISRRVLDAELLKEAQRAGARIVQPARCERIEPGPEIASRDLLTNQVTSYRPTHLLIADGKASEQTGDLGFKAHFESVDDSPETISLFGLDGHYVGLAAIEGGRWNLAMSVPAAKVKRFAGDGDRLFAQLLSENSALRQRMREARRIGEWLAAPLPRFAVQRSWTKGVIPIGNAAAALEPIGGEGMGLAMKSAELAVDELVAAEREKRDVATAQLQRRMRKLWSTRSLACRAGAIILSSPTAAKWMRRMEPLAPAVLRLVGK